MKDAWYDFFVRKNEWIRREYERYVIEHIEEHDKLRFLHWLVLLRLNWHYRILRKKTPLLYENRDGGEGRERRPEDWERRSEATEGQWKREASLS